MRITGIAHWVRIGDSVGREYERMEISVGGCSIYAEAPAVVLLTLENHAPDARRISVELALLPDVARSLARKLIASADDWQQRKRVVG